MFDSASSQRSMKLNQNIRASQSNTYTATFQNDSSISNTNDIHPRPLNNLLSTSQFVFDLIESLS